MEQMTILRRGEEIDECTTRSIGGTRSSEGGGRRCSEFLLLRMILKIRRCSASCQCDLHRAEHDATVFPPRCASHRIWRSTRMHESIAVAVIVGAIAHGSVAKGIGRNSCAK